MRAKILLMSLTALGFSLSTSVSSGMEKISHGGTSGGGGGTSTPPGRANRVAAGCEPSKSKTDLDINNVRTTILGGGDMWWDLKDQKYEIPKDGGRHSLFAGALWIGGVDAGGQLKVAAMNYRQGGNDFFPGPIDLATVTISPDECQKYDKHWKLTRQEVQDFVNWYNDKTSVSGYSGPSTNITTWPGNGNSNQTTFLAPFNDVNGDGLYDPAGSGDYPNYDLNGTAPCTSCDGGTGTIDPNYKDILFGDQTLWWVFNDVGNIHSETSAEAIGLEVQSQAFAFTTNDEINNMTFYQYKIINRSTYQLNDTYFGQWVDADLGGGGDDYVGCDVERGLGYCFNGDAYDDDGSGNFAGEKGYGANPPAVGVDFFQGPLADAGDGIDNNKNCVVDEKCEQIIMSKFVYYNNDNSLTGEPGNGSQFYNYLKGIWKDQTNMTYGGNGHNSGGPQCNYMFPDKSDHQVEWGTGGTCASPGAAQPTWNEVTSGNTPADRRFLQSAGKFTLTPGAVNYITTGVVWARASSGDNLASVVLLKQADDKAQALFDNCFKVRNGPDAPDLTIRELDKSLILSLTNKPSSNNFNELYSEVDPLIPTSRTYTYFTYDSLRVITGSGDTVMTLVKHEHDSIAPFNNKFKFEGYTIYQLKDKDVSVTDLQNPDKARLAFECDIKNGVTKLVNYTFDQTLNAAVPTEGVNGQDNGIAHSIVITDDLFATGVTTLVNHKTYYYMALAYSYNSYKPYLADIDPDPASPYAPANDGQKTPYFPGRRNIKKYSAIPHMPLPNNGGEVLQAHYGDMPIITRQEGKGNGGLPLDFSAATVAEILSGPPYRSEHPVYQRQAGPVNIKVYDPVSVPKGDFVFKMLLNDVDSFKAYSTISTKATWLLTNTTTGESVSSDQTIQVSNEQLIPAWGLSVNATQCLFAGPSGDPLGTNGYIKDTTTVGDITKDWLGGIPDVDLAGLYFNDLNSFNWVRSGITVAATGMNSADNDYIGFDDNQKYEKVVVRTYTQDQQTVTGGIWAPFRLCAYQRQTGPATTDVAVSGPGLYDPKGVLYYNSSVVVNEGDGLLNKANRMKDLSSVDVVFTPDKTKWSRCVVLEASDEKNLSVGLVDKLSPRSGASVGQDGKSDGTGKGMGWFPGYALNLETGQRLNIMFAEDSHLIGENGNDMIWNPTNTVVTTLSEMRFGGKHYVYVMGSQYDECANYKSLFDANNPSNNNNKLAIFKEARWVTIPIVDSLYAVKSGQVFVPPTETAIKIRISKPYSAYSYMIANAGDVSVPENNNHPMYTFNTNDLYCIKNNLDSAKSALDLINVVPNPYYAYSSYELSGTDNIVKITNIPSSCTISIYTISGNLIRKITRGVTADVSMGAEVEKVNLETSVDWNLTNGAGTPISSGVYLIHVQVDGVGERVIKWFGVMRPIDLTTY